MQQTAATILQLADISGEQVSSIARAPLLRAMAPMGYSKVGKWWAAQGSNL